MYIVKQKIAMALQLTLQELHILCYLCLMKFHELLIYRSFTLWQNLTMLWLSPREKKEINSELDSLKQLDAEEIELEHQRQINAVQFENDFTEDREQHEVAHAQGQ